MSNPVVPVTAPALKRCSPGCELDALIREKLFLEPEDAIVEFGHADGLSGPRRAAEAPDVVHAALVDELAQDVDILVPVSLPPVRC